MISEADEINPFVKDFTNKYVGIATRGNCRDKHAEDPRNTWALEGRFRASARTVELPLVPCTVSVLQRWRQKQHGGLAEQLETDAPQATSASSKPLERLGNWWVDARACVFSCVHV